MSRKSLFVLLVVALLVGIVVPAAAQDKVTVTWLVGLGTGTNDQQIEAQNQVVADFNASQDEIELVINIGADFATTRDLMKQMEADLGTRLDWIAVDHHNTGHPHTHIIVRGVTDDGKTLNVAGDYIAHGIRERASEAVTRELGRQTEQEVSRSLEREVDADRFTRLDRMLIAEQETSNEFADLRPDKDMLDMFRSNRALLIERARMLERLGLATEHQSGL